MRAIDRVFVENQRSAFCRFGKDVAVHERPLHYTLLAPLQHSGKVLARTIQAPVEVTVEGALVPFNSWPRREQLELERWRRHLPRASVLHADARHRAHVHLGPFENRDRFTTMAARALDTGAMRAATLALARAGKAVSLVPTMGALHDGHASLIRRSRADGHATLVSVFVNPTQFGPSEDFDRYPRTHEADFELATRAGADLVWFPQVHDLYPSASADAGAMPRLGVSGTMHVHAGPTGHTLCGASRPGFFDGVCTVVLKLFQLSRARVAHFGEKDWQQLVVIRQMAREFHLDVDIRGAPVVRELDGLAMSSRNRYLQPHDRVTALALYRLIRLAQSEFAAGELCAERLETKLLSAWRAEESAAAGALRLDYLALREPESLLPVAKLTGSTRLLLAAHLGDVRLIDNAALSGSV